jgi:hypothetical protein
LFDDSRVRSEIIRRGTFPKDVLHPRWVQGQKLFEFFLGTPESHTHHLPRGNPGFEQ